MIAFSGTTVGNANSDPGMLLNGRVGNRIYQLNFELWREFLIFFSMKNRHNFTVKLSCETVCVLTA